MNTCLVHMNSLRDALAMRHDCPASLSKDVVSSAKIGPYRLMINLTFKL